jgi:hypothetical protein
MRASIIPLEHRGRWGIGIGAMVLLALLFARGPVRAPTRAPAPAPASALATAAFASAGQSAGQSADGEPDYSPGSHHLLWADDFDRAERSVVPRDGDSRYGRYVTLGAPSLQFDPGSGVDGSGALRIAWRAAPAAGTALGAPCSDDSRLIEASFPAARELYVQYWVRYDRGFVFDWGRRGRCSGNAKKLLLLWAREGSRFVFISENGTLGVGSDHDHPLFGQNRAVAVTPASLGDGRWHRITFHVRQSSAPSRADGAIHGWIDGVQRWSYEGVATHNAGGYHLFKMPATFNQGSPVAQTEWLDRLRVWRPL